MVNALYSVAKDAEFYPRPYQVAVSVEQDTLSAGASFLTDLTVKEQTWSPLAPCQGTQYYQRHPTKTRDTLHVHVPS